MTRVTGVRFVGDAVSHASAELERVDDEHHVPKVHVPSPQLMDQWGIGTGGSHTMPHSEADAGLLQPAEA